MPKFPFLFLSEIEPDLGSKDDQKSRSETGHFPSKIAGQMAFAPTQGVRVLLVLIATFDLYGHQNSIRAQIQRVSDGFHLIEIAIRKSKEGRPVRIISMSAAVLPKSDVAINERSFNWWHFSNAKIFFAKKFIDWTREHGTHEHAGIVNPEPFDLWRSAADEHWSRSTEGDQFVRIDGEIVWR
jgi:hypothetical protein